MRGGRGSLQGLRALALSALLLCGCSSQISYWDVGMVPADAPETIELPLLGVANLDDLFKTVSLDEGTRTFRFSVIRYGARISADFRSGKIP